MKKYVYKYIYIHRERARETEIVTETETETETERQGHSQPHTPTSQSHRAMHTQSSFKISVAPLKSTGTSIKHGMISQVSMLNAVGAISSQNFTGQECQLKTVWQ